MTWPRAGAIRVVPIVATIARYQRGWLKRDALASLTLWALLVPQALAYSGLAGLPPAAGLYTGLLGMLGYAIFATTRALTVGPESTIAIIVASTITPIAGTDRDHYAALAALLAVLTGGFLFLGAAARAGFVTKFFSAPVLTGYLCGSGVVIALSQLSKVLGYSVQGSYPTAIGGLVHEIQRTSLVAVLIGAGTIVTMLAMRRWLPGVPAALVSLALATIVVSIGGLNKRLQVVGSFDTAPPWPSFGGIRLSEVNALIAPAISIAVFVFATTVLAANAIEKDHADLLDPNQEFRALGAANLAVGLVGGFPANSSSSRSFALAQAGARSQVANLFGCAAVGLSLLFLTPLFHNLPSAALAGVILVTAIGLIDIKGLRRLYQLRTADFVLAAITLAGVIITGPMGGIVVGIVASLMDVIRRTIMPRTAVLGRVPDQQGQWRDTSQSPEAATVPGVLVYRFEAPLFFGNADLFRHEVVQLVDTAIPPVHDVIVNAEGINDLDVTGAEAITALAKDLRDRDVRLSFARLRTPVRRLMQRVGQQGVLGEHIVYMRVEDAVQMAARRGAAVPGDGLDGTGRDGAGSDGDGSGFGS
jgi:SulP family sulfate permease